MSKQNNDSKNEAIHLYDEIRNQDHISENDHVAADTLSPASFSAHVYAVMQIDGVHCVVDMINTPFLIVQRFGASLEDMARAQRVATRLCPLTRGLSNTPSHLFGE